MLSLKNVSFGISIQNLKLPHFKKYYVCLIVLYGQTLLVIALPLQAYFGWQLTKVKQLINHFRFCFAVYSSNKVYLTRTRNQVKSVLEHSLVPSVTFLLLNFDRLFIIFLSFISFKVVLLFHFSSKQRRSDPCYKALHWSALINSNTCQTPCSTTFSHYNSLVAYFRCNSIRFAS